MEDNQLKLLEQRVSNAVAFIEKMKGREKSLQDEKERVEQKVVSMQRIIEEKDLKIEALRENQLFLKSKIETILDKLEGLASMEEVTEEAPEQEGSEQWPSVDQETADEEVSENDVFAHTDSRNTYPGGEAESESIIVEENLVDLKDAQTENQEQEDSDTSDIQDGGIGDAEKEMNSKEDTNRKDRYEGERGNDLFDNPFIEM